jgi:hypothetical protein
MRQETAGRREGIRDVKVTVESRHGGGTERIERESRPS